MHIVKVYRDAWTQEGHEPDGQYLRDVFVSLAGPTLVLWALWDACGEYEGKDYQTALSVASVVLLISLGVMEMGCCALTRGRSNGRVTARQSEDGSESSEEEPPRGSPMLAFAVLLFSTGAAFTLVEIFDHILGPIGVVNSNPECAANPHADTCSKRLVFWPLNSWHHGQTRTRRSLPMPRGRKLASLTLTDEQQNQLQGIAQSTTLPTHRSCGPASSSPAPKA